jgi:hypothetical protein
MAHALLSLNMSVIELIDEGVCPSLAGVVGDVMVVQHMPLPPILQSQQFKSLSDSDLASYLPSKGKRVIAGPGRRPLASPLYSRTILQNHPAAWHFNRFTQLLSNHSQVPFHQFRA